MNQRYELAHEIIWDGTRSGPVGSKSANRHLLFWEPEYAEEEDPPVTRIIVRKPCRQGLSSAPERRALVLAAMGDGWTRPCFIARQISLSSDQAWLTLRGMVEVGQVEVKNTASIFSRGVLWYRRVSA